MRGRTAMHMMRCAHAFSAPQQCYWYSWQQLNELDLAVLCAAPMNAHQRYLFDTRGVFTVPKVLTATQLAELNRIFDQIEASDDPALGGRGKMGGDDALHWGAVYRELLDLPTISPILEELVGNHRAGSCDVPTFRIDHINVHNRCKGRNHPFFAGYFKGHDLHGGGLGNSGNHGGGGSQFFRYQDGHFFNGLTVVAFELQDTHCNGGGFCCVPGSHTGHVAMPSEWRDMGNSDNLEAPWLYKVKASPGDAIIFTEALTHGAIPWTCPTSSRRTLFYKYSPHATSWSGQYYNQDEYARYEDVTDRHRAILKPPSAHTWVPKGMEHHPQNRPKQDGVGEMQRVAAKL